MSDLFCPATILVCRHGEATYEHLGILSDDGGWLSDLGRRQAAELAARLADRRVAAVWCSDMARAVQTAEIVAGRLAVPVRVHAGLREASVGGFAGRPLTDGCYEEVFLRWLDGDLAASAPDAESGADVVRRMQDVLALAADQFRGETVLLVSHGAAIGVTLPALAGNVPDDYARGRSMPNCAVSELTSDADSVTLRSWAGQPVG